MYFTVARKELYDALRIVGKAVSAQSTLPVLKNVMIEPGPDEIRLTGSDLELSIEVRVRAKVSGKTAITLPKGTLTDIIANLPEGDVTVTLDEKDNASIKCGRSSFVVPGLPAEDFPPVAEVKSEAVLQISQPLFGKMLRQVLFATSDDDTRPILIGVLFRVEDGRLTLAATDTHRLAVRSEKVADGSDFISAIVPARALRELLQALSGEEQATLTLRADPNQILFATEKVTLVSRLIEGQFPRYERVIPSQFTRRGTMQVDELASALRRVRIVARDAAAKDRVIFAHAEQLGQPLMTLSAEGDGAKAHEEVDLVWEGEPLSIAFNVNYLLDALGGMSEGVFLEMTEPLSAAALRPVNGEDYVQVLMPMQVL